MNKITAILLISLTPLVAFSSELQRSFKVTSLQPSVVAAGLAVGVGGIGSYACWSWGSNYYAKNKSKVETLYESIKNTEKSYLKTINEIVHHNQLIRKASEAKNKLAQLKDAFKPLVEMQYSFDMSEAQKNILKEKRAACRVIIEGMNSYRSLARVNNDATKNDELLQGGLLYPFCFYTDRTNNLMNIKNEDQKHDRSIFDLRYEIDGINNRLKDIDDSIKNLQQTDATTLKNLQNTALLNESEYRTSLRAHAVEKRRIKINSHRIKNWGIGLSTLAGLSAGAAYWWHKTCIKQ